MTTDTSASETSTSAEPTNVSSGSETNIATARETSSDSPEPTPPQTRSNLGLIVGVTVAGVVCVAGLAFVIVCVRKRRRRAKTSVMPPTGDPIKEHPDKRVMLGPILPVSEMADTPVSTTPYELEAYDEPQPQARI
ncbi:hypothetical protein FQN57_007396 [Myotisia sp. PD_48]|nr:hypothetical protein FQN57_007396 [Myotisia sp. PD_48]